MTGSAAKAVHHLRCAVTFRHTSATVNASSSGDGASGICTALINSRGLAPYVTYSSVSGDSFDVSGGEDLDAGHFRVLHYVPPNDGIADGATQ